MNMMIDVDEKNPMVAACQKFLGSIVVGDVLHHLEAAFSAGWNAAQKNIEAGQNGLTTAALRSPEEPAHSKATS